MTDATLARRIMEALVHARTHGGAADLSTELLNQVDMDTSLQVQQLTLDHLSRPAAAWKVAVLPDGAVLSAPIADNLFFRAPAHLPRDLYGQGGIECEIAFRIAGDLPPRPTPYSRGDVAACVESACVAVEVLNSRLATKFDSPRNAMLADMLSNAALVVGDPVREWHDSNFRTIPVQLFVRGESVLSRQGGHPNGDPFDGVIALANHLAARGLALKAGSYVTTGSFTGVHFAAPGDEIRVSFDGFPELRLMLEDSGAADHS
jgi:2-keto-4-pentenoate hydratase